ncbi:sigma-54-dependent transcriptional regulator [Fibrobacterota bacterium]
MEHKKIMIVDDDLSLLRVIDHHLTGAGHNTTAISKPKEAVELLDKEQFDIILCDMKMPDISGMDILKKVHQRDADVVFIVITGYPTVEEAVEAMKLGAFDFIQKPVDKTHLLRVIGKASELITLRRENVRLKSLVKEQFEFDKIIARSGAMRKVCTQAAQVALSNVPILITGETGTGKELLAKAVHNNSKVKEGPFVAVNCGAIPASLIESELFGHTRGAFTGAVTDRKGLFEAASRGTIFLDEIGDLPLNLQSKLLRVLQDNKVVPVGSNKSIHVDVRIVSATHRNLTEMVKQGTFREDLYYRLNVVPLALPPLRDRVEDIPLLFKHFVKSQLERDGKNMPAIGRKIIKHLENYNWPGNVRELENLAQRIVALHSGSDISQNDLPDNIKEHRKTGTSIPELPDAGLDLEEWIDKMVVMALRKNEWNQSRTAKYLNISRNTLIYRMEKRGLRPK